MATLEVDQRGLWTELKSAGGKKEEIKRCKLYMEMMPIMIPQLLLQGDILN